MNDSFKKISTFLVLVSGLALIFELPYIRNSFYVPICQALNLNNQEFGVLSSIYSTVSLVMYVAGGFLSDRLNSRWLLFLPFAGTGILGFWFSRFPDYGELKIIFALMGITTVMTFFSTSIRILKNLGGRYEQGRIFGWMEAGKGIFAGVTFFVIQLLFQALGEGRFGFEWVIKAYAILNIILGIGVVLVVPDEYIHVERTIPLKQEIRDVVLNPRVWIMCLIVFSGYSMYALLSFVSPFFLKAYNSSIEVSRFLSTWRYGIQIVGAVLAGYLADRARSGYKIIFGGFILMLASILVFIIQPYDMSSLVLGIFGFIAFSIAVYGIKGLYYALISENSIDSSCIGGTVGIVAAIGYLPDTFMYSMVGNWIDAGMDGYYRMFTYAIVVILLGTIVTGIMLTGAHPVKRRKR